MKHKPLIVANWKMNPETAKQAVKNFQEIKKIAITNKNVETVICAAFPHLGLLSGEVTERMQLGAQDVFYEDAGLYTGAVSPLMLRDLKTTYVIIGHSSRRALGETDQDVAKKVMMCIKHSLTPIICVGEKSRDNDDYSNFVADQIKQAVSLIPVEAVPQIVLTYEPVWAISSEKKYHSATPQDAKEMGLFCRKTLTDIAGDYANNVRVIYGGSANPDNTAEFLTTGGAEGLLVGNASLDPKTFGEMIEIANNL